MASPAVELSQLTKRYDPLPRWMRFIAKSAARSSNLALDRVDLTVESGTICAIVGPNGAGKSTLFRVLTGLTTPTDGTARVLGVDCSDRGDIRHLPIGFMPADERALMLRLSCRENLMFQGQLRGLSGATLRTRAAEVLDLVGLGPVADTAAYALSSGMKARLLLARAMVHRPKVLILDEPTATIDPVAADDLLQLIQRLTAQHSLAVLLSSHRLEEIDALDEVVLLLDRGRVAYSGALRDLRALATATTVNLVLDDASAATRIVDRLCHTEGIGRVVRQERNVEVSATTGLGEVMWALGDDVRHVVHIDEQSSSTRGLLRSIYESSPVAEGVG